MPRSERNASRTASCSPLSAILVIFSPSKKNSSAIPRGTRSPRNDCQWARSTVSSRTAGPPGGPRLTSRRSSIRSPVHERSTVYSDSSPPRDSRRRTFTEAPVRRPPGPRCISERSMSW